MEKVSIVLFMKGAGNDSLTLTVPKSELENVIRVIQNGESWFLTGTDGLSVKASEIAAYNLV